MPLPSFLSRFLVAAVVAVASWGASAQPAARDAGTPQSLQSRDDYVVGAGDVIRIQVFQNPDLTVEARVSEAGAISYPLLGALRIGGLSPTAVERLIADRLKSGNFLQNPQVTVNITTFRSQQVSVLGNVNRPGRYPLETTGMRLSEVLSLAGGVAPTGADEVVLITRRGGAAQRVEVDLVDLFASGDVSKDPALVAGDVMYVNRAPNFYIYGQVNRPGMYTLERGMTLAQAIAKGGGLTLRGSDRGVRVHRRYGNKSVQVLEPKLEDAIRPDDLLFIRESVF
ncbi:MAG: polysaccharide export protein EpsE [Burkholderiales bacterium]|nr:MAG: polysaccharide export protein EpsE [Burkholderiales bacterium]